MKPERRGRRAPALSVAQILRWADAHHARTGRWPSASSGAVTGAGRGTWSAVNAALRGGLRGLPGGDTLSRLLRRERAAPETRGRPRHQLRRLRAARLRAAGLTVAAVGRRLGITRQGAFALLRSLDAGDRPERKAQ